jgi:hypothetical protein
MSAAITSHLNCFLGKNGHNAKMQEETRIIDVNYKKELLKSLAFVLANGCVAVTFSVLWIWQYHIDSNLSDHIDEIVVPWVWIICFFTASFLPLRGAASQKKALIASIGFSLLFSFLLFLTVHFVIVPFFDPHF